MFFFTAYACVGVLLAIVELVTVVLACAYVAQITRRRRRDEMFSRYKLSMLLFLY